MPHISHTTCQYSFLQSSTAGFPTSAFTAALLQTPVACCSCSQHAHFPATSLLALCTAHIQDTKRSNCSWQPCWHTTMHHHTSEPDASSLSVTASYMPNMMQQTHRHASCAQAYRSIRACASPHCARPLHAFFILQSSCELPVPL